MSLQAQTEPKAVMERLERAINEHDLEAFVAAFRPEYESEQPAHTDRAFRGSDQVRQNWGAIFTGVPDIRAELLRSAVDGETAWAEWHWQGNRTDGTRMDMRGVTIMGVRDGRIAWGRLYMEPVEQAGAGIDEAVRDMSQGSQGKG